MCGKQGFLDLAKNVCYFGRNDFKKKKSIQVEFTIWFDLFWEALSLFVITELSNFWGVPQGSVLGPLISIPSCLPLGLNNAHKYVLIHIYVDVQLFISLTVTRQEYLISFIKKEEKVENSKSIE